MRWLVWFGHIVIAWCIATPRVSAAQDFFSSSPGALSASHGRWDKPTECNACHDGGRDVVQQKCLDCHDHQDLKQRIAAGDGFHASALVKGKACESCHTEHKGRGKDIMGWSSIQGGEKGFDHELAGWRLSGKHATTPCAECHKDKNQQGLRTFLGLDKLCGSCHKDDQPHEIERKSLLACERCHTESVWNPAKANSDFDHDDKNDAAMPLVGAHVDVSCAKCHPKSLFNLPEDPPDGCGNSGCHNSPHEGHLFGKKACTLCHSPKFQTLAKIRFDHDRNTKFDLGAHQKLACEKCHTKSLGVNKPNRSCEQVGCHANDNAHENRFAAYGAPPRCETCHTSGNTWKRNIFDHNKETRFALTAAHAQATCRDCHRGSKPSQFEKFDAKKIGCMGCHKHANVHEKKWNDGQCKNCHKPGDINVSRDTAVKSYHGPASRFPLVKGHKGVPCAACHKAAADGKTVFTELSVECGEGCHEDSLHKGSLGDECSRCHVPGIWKATQFDHSEDSKFELKGLHRTVPECEDCHVNRKFKGIPTTCGEAGCHLEDDSHKRALGTDCGRCHLETGDNKFDHNSMARFALTGRHTDVRCADCHPSIAFKPRPTDCVGCHPEPLVHKGLYGTDCARCHTTSNFQSTLARHDVGDFSLGGSHNQVACATCHLDNRPLGGTGNHCAQCHRQDDIHNGALSPRCGECHTQWSFAPARFDHLKVGCALRGLHRTLPCADCHTSGSFGGTLGTCNSCHLDEALRQPDHAARLMSCGGCHNTNTWTPGAAAGESVCR